MSEAIPEISFSLTPSESVPTPVDETLTISGQAADAAAVGDAISDLGTTTAENLAAAVSAINAAIAALFPVGAVYASVSSTAPVFYGTWVEIVIPTTWGDLNTGNRSFTSGTGEGTLHFWQRTE